jgi:SAM-dependent methyltransferase
MPKLGTPDSPWLAKLSSLAECKAAGLVPDILSPIPTEDLFLSGYCAVCEKPTRFRLGRDHYHEKWGYFFREALSCSHCTLNARMRAALQYLGDLALPKSAKIYMTEQVTPMFRHVSGRYPNTQGSEYLPGKELGSIHEGIRCEDLQALTFAAESFDAIISLDVLEHIPDYRAGLREMCRVLRKQGALILTCPFIMQLPTIRAQARLDDRGEVEHLIPVPEYHGNPLGPPSLSFNTFGWQLLEDMRHAGFSEAHLIPYRNRELGYVGGPFPLLVGIA